MQFACSTCHSFAAITEYKAWLAHLTSKFHQGKTLAKYGSLYLGVPRQGYKGACVEDSSYLVVGEYGFEKLYDLAVWCTQFGVVTEFIFYKREKCCAVVIQDAGATRPGVEAILEQSFQNIGIEVFKLSTMNYDEWKLAQKCTPMSDTQLELKESVRVGGQPVEENQTDAVAAGDSCEAEVVAVTEEVTKEENEEAIDYRAFAMYWRF